MAYQRKTERLGTELLNLSLPSLPERTTWLSPDGRGRVSLGPHLHDYPGKVRDRRPVVFIDTETTGLDTQKDVILSIACIVWQDGIVTDAEEIFLNPGSIWSEEAERIHGISREQAAEFPAPKEGLRKLTRILPENAVLAGHNVPYDRRMLESMIHRHDTPVPSGKNWLVSGLVSDTLIWAKRYGLPGKLEEALKAAECPVYKTHDALQDIVMTCNLWCRLMDAVARRRPHTIFY